ncbi:hypothetical protein ES703_95028 [subsurface metagenome]
MGMRTKKKLLEHYSEGEISEFTQFDAFPGPGDSVLVPCKDGISYTYSISSELMSPCFVIRVLVTPGTKKEIAVKALRGIADWIEKSFKNKDLGIKLIKEIKEEYVSRGCMVGEFSVRDDSDYPLV